MHVKVLWPIALRLTDSLFVLWYSYYIAASVPLRACRKITFIQFTDWRAWLTPYLSSGLLAVQFQAHVLVCWRQTCSIFGLLPPDRSRVSQSKRKCETFGGKTAPSKDLMLPRLYPPSYVVPKPAGEFGSYYRILLNGTGFPIAKKVRLSWCHLDRVDTKCQFPFCHRFTLKRHITASD